MSLNNTPSGNRIHIGIFGRRNAGKSSLINAITGQDLSIVSEQKGTTTDPVQKAMEILPLGPVVLIDTPGLDDEGELGEQRIKKAYQMLNKTDIALLVVDGKLGITRRDLAILRRIQDKKIPYLIVVNKSDVLEDFEIKLQFDLLADQKVPVDHTILVSAFDKTNINELRERLAQIAPQTANPRSLISDKVKPLDTVILVIPIDESAPKARLILPQQQTIRDLLEAGAITICVKETELADTLKKLSTPPALVITDSQAFGLVSKVVPEEVPLTSFSILFARYKGNLSTVVPGAFSIDALEDGDTILISEGCTHHRQCGDIGTVKLPKWLNEYTGKKLNYEFTSGTEFPLELNKYQLIIHCGGCMLNEKEMKFRHRCARDAGVPITNYGTAIAYLKGILRRSVAIFDDEFK